MKNILLLLLPILSACIADLPKLQPLLQERTAKGFLVEDPVQSDVTAKVALIIGNSNYTLSGYLRNPVHDASDMAKILEHYGFDVIHYKNLDHKQMTAAVRLFKKRISEDGVSLFFYAGHGIQVDDQNYLLPVDADIKSAVDVQYQAINAQWIVETMHHAQSRINIVILDACRNNPYRSFVRSQDGFSKMDTPHGTLISYATAAGKKAADGSGRNGLYTKNLLKAINTPGLSLERVFKKAATSIAKESRNQQIPWISSSLTGKDFCFTGACNETDVALKKQTDENKALQAKNKALQDKLDHLKQQNSTVSGEFQDILEDGTKGPEMVWIAGGSFEMGSNSGYSDEKPVHTVKINRFAMGKYEVTFAEYDKFANATGRTKPDDRGWGRGNRPVIYVSWNDATAYTKWLSDQTGHTYRLPTEAEWEYAARAGTDTKYWWGDSIGANKANCGSDCGDSFRNTAPVGSFGANPWGLHDTVGNVWEWVQDWYDSSYYSSRPPNNPTGPSTGQDRVRRGGGWRYGASLVRTAFRIYNRPGVRYFNLGFRLYRTRF